MRGSASTIRRIVQARALMDDLPLFAAATEPEHAADPLAEAVDAIEPDSLSPRDALQLLYDLKRIRQSN